MLVGHLLGLRPGGRLKWTAVALKAVARASSPARVEPSIPSRTKCWPDGAIASQRNDQNGVACAGASRPPRWYFSRKGRMRAHLLYSGIK